MTYQETIQYLYASQPAFHIVGAAAYKPGLDNTYRLMAHLGNPHKQLRTIHIAGTNGKGSTSHLVAASLQAQGYKVGLFTSPHLVDFRERIRLSGEMIPEEMVIEFVENNRAFLDEVHPSFFETTMALAFWYFAEQQVDIAVIEVGLGGRLDSTNILTPILSVITNIGIDHTEFLGTTLTQIAHEKAGIIKSHIPCVIGETHPETQEVFLNRARECDILGDGLETTECRIWFADQCGFMRRRRLKEAPICQLQGCYQEKNQQTAFVALQVLHNHSNIKISPEAIATGFAQVCSLTGLRGRWEILSKSPLTICDTGHNSHGIRYVVEQLKTENGKRETENGKLHIVFGMVADKDIDVVLSMLSEEAVYYFTQPATSRALPASQLLAQWQSLHPTHQACHCFDSVATAITTAQKEASNEDIIFIGGSNYVVGEALSLQHL
ncbi:MAG: bifunctional folylpolyglutamate synthase/dihydrofolate synthase [Paludibacteraceae bacterium]|nr:bifunctional folylpolyglutamate synthase/dihydrofolate synthase [Paludibacteraceae bacterium]